MCYDLYTCGAAECIHETERMQNKHLKNDVLLSLPEERERHEESNSQLNIFNDIQLKKYNENIIIYIFVKGNKTNSCGMGNSY